MTREIKHQVIDDENNIVGEESFTSTCGWLHEIYSEEKTDDGSRNLHGGVFPMVGMSYLRRRVYTGLRDKNGVGIYEGDILSVSGHQDLTVVFRNGMFSGAYDGGKAEICPDELWRMIKYIEVIGNVYENPDLLAEGEKEGGE